MAYTVQEFLAYMDSPEYKAKVEADRRAREAAEDDYFDKLGELVERHPVGRPTSRSSLIRLFDGQAAKAKPETPDFSAITRAVVRKP